MPYGQGQIDPQAAFHATNFTNRLKIAIAAAQTKGDLAPLQNLQKEIDALQSPWEKAQVAKQNRDAQFANTMLLHNQSLVAQNEAGKEQQNFQSYRYHTSEIDKAAKPLEDSLGRFSRLKDTLEQGSKQADSLIARSC